MADPAIELEGLTRRYGDRDALVDVSLTLPAGATLVVFGPNGAGKTTLLRILATLLRPHGGSARVLGHALPGAGWAVRGHVGFLGHASLLYRDLTARENLRFHARLHGAPPERVEALLDAVGLRTRADDPVHTYSRGMVQRAAGAPPGPPRPPPPPLREATPPPRPHPPRAGGPPPPPGGGPAAG